jgi:NADPH:quinone reductase-like Zn-dependent oxidoreductase
MKAIQYRPYGGPEPSNGDVLVEMRINPLLRHLSLGAFLRRDAREPAAYRRADGSGVVVETKSADFTIGDRVIVTGKGYGLVADGTWR